jgi:hypothetical protein
LNVRTWVRGFVAVGAAVVIATVASAGCTTPTLNIPAPRSQCTTDAPACILFNLTLSENGQPVDFVQIPSSALASADGGVLSAAGNPPEYTSTPAAMTFTPTADTQTLVLDWTDPTASRPSHVMTLRPHGPDNKMCLAPCCWGCRATHRVFDKLVAGRTTYTVTSPVDPLTTAGLDLVMYPVSSTQPGVDPVTLLNSPGGGSQSTLIMGNPITVPVTVVAPPNGPASSSGSGSTSSGGTSSGSGSGSGGPPSKCSNDTDCISFGKNYCEAGCSSVSDSNDMVRCFPDGTCHCCDGVIGSGTGNCSCQSCPCPDTCQENVCCNTVGGAPNMTGG